MLTFMTLAALRLAHHPIIDFLFSVILVAVSATLPNLGHLASFIESGEAYMFDQSYRPVPLNVYVQGCGHIGNNRYLFDKSLKQHVPSILKRFSSNRPSIVFCHSKKETEELADELTREYGNRMKQN
jgi:ATP-dependent DNA helicase HFM1/MER3